VTESFQSLIELGCRGSRPQSFFADTNTKPNAGPLVVYWIFPASALVGLGLGLRHKVPAVAALSLAVVVASVLLAIANSWSTAATFGGVAATLVALQAGFLAGAALSGR
jgi:hypothetical protein